MSEGIAAGMSLVQPFSITGNHPRMDEVWAELVNEQREKHESTRRSFLAKGYTLTDASLRALPPDGLSEAAEWVSVILSAPES